MFGQREITFHFIQLFLIIKFVTPYCAPSSKNITHKTKQRIFNGIPASLGEVPYQIAFRFCAYHDGDSMTFCGGSIIKPTIIVSAAHCFAKEGRKFSYRGPTLNVKLNSKKYFAVAGNLNTYEKCEQGGGQWRTLKQIKVPYNYKFPKSDVAIVYVKKFVWNNDVKPIPYASKNLHYGSISCQISGYGDINGAEYDKDVVIQSKVLLKANVKLIDSIRCEKLVYRNMKKFICTEHHISDSGKLRYNMEHQRKSRLNKILSLAQLNQQHDSSRSSSVEKYDRTSDETLKYYDDVVVKSVSFVDPKLIKIYRNKQITVAIERDSNLLPKKEEVNTLEIVSSQPEEGLDAIIPLVPPSSPIEYSEYKIESIGVEFNTIQNEMDIDRTSPSILIKSAVFEINERHIDDIPMYDLRCDEANLEPLDDLKMHTNEEESTDTKRKRSIKCDQRNWDISKRKALREKGEQYKGKKKNSNTWDYNVVKQKKVLKSRCGCREKNSVFKCVHITDEERNNIFQNFWVNMSWQEKKMYVKTLTVVKPTERKRTDSENSKRKQSLELYLDVNSFKKRVCRTMFLNTLAIGEWMLHSWTKQDMITRKETTKLNEKETQVKIFFDSLPKLESHYCRSQSSKLYLEPIWRTKTELLMEYNEVFSKDKGFKPVSITTLSSLFDTMNLSLFRPKKDLCDTCEAAKCKNIPEEVYLKHIKMKDAARKEKSIDKEGDKEVLTMDLQSVLLCPKSNASALYYKTKLIVHNFTVYDIKRSDGYCFVWNETEGGLTANEFSSIIIKMLELFKQKHGLTAGSEIILYSDGCTYQNRNVTLSNALLHFAVKNNLTIIQKILEKGHTQMEADSMHSVIERQIRNKKINVPADYVNIAKSACKRRPYYVEYLNHTFFKKFDDLKTYKSIRPGRKAGDPVVTDVRQLRYLPDGQILYRLGFSEEYDENPLPLRVKLVDPVCMDDLPSLHNERLKIKKTKYEHLQQLKMVMEKDYHAFYDNIPYFE